MRLRLFALSVDEFTRKVLSSFWMIVLIIGLLALFWWALASVE